MAEREPKSLCCSIGSMCGRSLGNGIVYVSFTTMTVTIIALVLSTINVALITCSESRLNARPVLAFDLLFALVVSCVSIYQLIITALLLWQAMNTVGKIFLCSVWYVSHLSILVLYGVMFVVRVVVSFVEKRFFTVVITIIACLAYEGLFIYFAIVVNSYLHSLDQDRYF